DMFLGLFTVDISVLGNLWVRQLALVGMALKGRGDGVLDAVHIGKPVQDQDLLRFGHERRIESRDEKPMNEKGRPNGRASLARIPCYAVRRMARTIAIRTIAPMIATMKL